MTYGIPYNTLENVNPAPKPVEAFPYADLPLVTEGESKIVNYIGKGRVVIRYKPTIYSYTHNRIGAIPGTDTLRLRASKIFLNVIEAAGVRHAYKEVNEDHVISELLLNTNSEFIPDDYEVPDTIAPIEVIVKNYHTGTPKHRYYEMEKYPIRGKSLMMKILDNHQDKPKTEEKFIEPNQKYPKRVVRFDWRNPLHDRNGTRLADEVMPEQMANWYIDVENARETALKAFAALNKFLNARDIELQDICFIMNTDGTKIVSEISQDCGRYVYKGESLDKDVWRAGGSSELVAEKWKRILELIES